MAPASLAASMSMPSAPSGDGVLQDTGARECCNRIYAQHDACFFRKFDAQPYLFRKSSACFSSEELEAGHFESKQAALPADCAVVYSKGTHDKEIR
eukprot:scaffold58867_cov65-Phaeocystis_antarctica.AAC.2